MIFQDRSQEDPSQPLTLDRPLTDPRVDSPYPKPQQPAYPQARMPPAIYTSQFTQPPRAPDQYGQDWWTRQAATNYPGVPNDGRMPSGLEAYPAMATGNGYLAKWGSDNINQDAGQVRNLAMAFAPFLDILSRGAWSKEFNASSLNRIKLQQEQLVLRQEQLQMKHAEELTDYGSILSRADALVKAAGTDTAKAKRAIDDARDELRFIAETKYGHRPLVAMLNQTAGLDPVKDFLNREDAAFKESWAGLTSLKKVTNTENDAEISKEFGFGGGGGGAGDITPGIMQPTPTPEDPAEARGPQAPQTSTSNDYDRDLLRKSGASQTQLDMARQLSMGQAPHAYSELEKIPARDRSPLANRMLSGVNSLQNQITHDVEAAANIDNRNNDPNIAQQKLDRLRTANPALFAEVAGRGTYDIDPKDERIGNRPYINALTKRFFPDFNEDNYAVMRKYKDESSPSRKILTQAGAALQPISEFLKSLKTMPETDSVPMARAREWIAGNIENTGQYRELSIAMQQMAQRLSAITTGSGVTRVSIFNQRMREMQGYVSPKVLRSILKQEVADIWGSIGPYQNGWETTFKRNDIAPGITRKIWQGYESVLLMNPNTGEMPPGAPPEWASASKHATKGVKSEEAWTPLSPADQRRNYMEAQALGKNPERLNPNSPNHARLQHAYEELLKRELGIVNAPWERPDMD